MNEQYITGSYAFFKDIEGFTGRDKDFVVFDTEQEGSFTYTSEEDKDIFIWKQDTAEEMIAFMNKGLLFPSAVIVFLVPDIITRVGMTVELLPSIKPLIDKLDDAHKYIELIYNAYVENNNFTLTNEQLMAAYDEYNRERAVNNNE